MGLSSCSTRSLPPAPPQIIEEDRAERGDIQNETLLQECPEELPSPKEVMGEDTWAQIAPEQQVEFLLKFIKDMWVTEYFACQERHSGLVKWYKGE